MQVLQKSEMSRLSFQFQPWVSPGLPPILLTVEKFSSLVFVHHMSNAVPTSVEAPLSFYGNSIWVATTDDRRCVAICFNWREIAPSVLAIDDPLSISSNAHFVNDEGQLVDDYGRWRCLMETTRNIDWQLPAAEQLAIELEEQANSKVDALQFSDAANVA